MEGVWKMEQGGSKVVAFPHVNLNGFRWVQEWSNHYG